MIAWRVKLPSWIYGSERSLCHGEVRAPWVQIPGATKSFKCSFEVVEFPRILELAHFELLTRCFTFVNTSTFTDVKSNGVFRTYFARADPYLKGLLHYATSRANLLGVNLIGCYEVRRSRGVGRRDLATRHLW